MNKEYYKQMLHPGWNHRQNGYHKLKRWDLAADDPDPDNRISVVKYATKDDVTMNKFANDSHAGVREAAAYWGNTKVHEILQHDSDSWVRKAVVMRTDSRKILQHLTNDSDEFVKFHARNRLKHATEE